MTNTWTILKRELGAYFNSAIAYIYLIVFIAINNGLFMTRFFLIGKADMRSFFDTLPMILFIFIPVLSMRLWAEDKKENTFELLLTFPMKPAQIVVGKFLAGLIFYFIALVSTFTVPAILYATGRPDLGAVLGGYVGAFFIGALFLAVGIFISGLTKEQIVAFVLTVLSTFVIFLIGTDFAAASLDGWFSGLGSFLKNYVGVASHVMSFNRGVVDFKDIVYFGVTISSFLFLNSLFFEGRMRPKSKVIFTTAVFVCFLGVIVFNWLVSDIPFGRFDITENKIYTVSSASKRVLNSLKVPVLVKLYVTPVDKMPTVMKTLEQEIVGKLDELKIASGNKLKIEVVHLEAGNLVDQSQDRKEGEKATEVGVLEKSLQAKGILPFQVESIDRDEVGVKLVYSAMTVAYKEKGEEVLQRLVPQSIPDLEYLLLSRILKLTFENKPKIALFSPLKVREMSFEMSQLISQAGQGSTPQYEDEYTNIVPLMRNNGYDVVRVALSKNDPLPQDLNTLLVINPGPLNDRQMYEINKFLVEGGSVLIAAQGYGYNFQIAPPAGVQIMPEQLALDINRMIQGWGVKVSEQMLFDENCSIISLSTGQSIGPFAMSMPVKAQNQIVINEGAMNTSAPFMSRLPSLFYLWGSALEVSDDIIKQAALKKTLLFSSGERSWQKPFAPGFLQKEMLRFPGEGAPGKFPLAVMLEGQFSDTFTGGGGVPAWPADSGEQGKISPEVAKEVVPLIEKPGRLIVIGSSKMFSDQVMSNSANIGLFANIVDGLTLGDEVIQIRSKTPVSRDINKVSDQKKVFYRFVAILLMPLLLIIFASLRIFLRNKEKQFYALTLGRD